MLIGTEDDENVSELNRDENWKILWRYQKPMNCTPQKGRLQLNFYFLCARSPTQGLVHAKHILYHWAILLALVSQKKKRSRKKIKSK